MSRTTDDMFIKAIGLSDDPNDPLEEKFFKKIYIDAMKETDRDLVKTLSYVVGTYKALIASRINDDEMLKYVIEKYMAGEIGDH